MNRERLIDDLTELVCRQLADDGRARVPASALHWEGGGPAPPLAPSYPAAAVAATVSPMLPAPAGPARPRLLLVMGDGERGLEAWMPQMRVAATTARVVVVPSASFPRARLLALLGEGPVGDLQVLEQVPTPWDGLVRECRAVFVPNAGLNTVAGIAMLFATEPAVGAALRGIIEGRPVLVGSDEIDFLTLHAGHLARPFVQGVRGHASAAQSMGARLLDATALGQELVRLARNEADFAPSQPQGRGRSVLTKEDVEMLIRSGQTVIEVPSGSIVTSLAREVASRAGVEIQIR